MGIDFSCHCEENNPGEPDTEEKKTNKFLTFTSHLKTLFNELDEDSNGVVDAEELKKALAAHPEIQEMLHIDADLHLVLEKILVEDSERKTEFISRHDAVSPLANQEVEKQLNDIFDKLGDEEGLLSVIALQEEMKQHPELQEFIHIDSKTNSVNIEVFNADGKISRREFILALTMHHSPLMDHWIDELFSLIDRDNNQHISQKQFIKLLAPSPGLLRMLGISRGSEQEVEQALVDKYDEIRHSQLVVVTTIDQNTLRQYFRDHCREIRWV